MCFKAFLFSSLRADKALPMANVALFLEGCSRISFPILSLFRFPSSPSSLGILELHGFSAPSTTMKGKRSDSSFFSHDGHCANDFHWSRPGRASATCHPLRTREQRCGGHAPILPPSPPWCCPALVANTLHLHKSSIGL